MAVARALAVASPSGSLWPSVTHLASNSGGSWFSSQFCFGAPFYHAVLNASLSVHDLVAQWGGAYSLRLLVERQNASGVKPLHGKCHAIDDALDALVGKIMDVTKMPASRWVPYAAAILRDEIAGVDAGRTYSARAGLRSATYLQTMSLPPDAFLTAGSSTGLTAAAGAAHAAGAAPSSTPALSSIGLFLGNESIAGRHSGFAVPLGFAADAKGRTEWSLHPGVRYGPTLAAAVPLPLPADPPILTVTAASSAAIGLVCSLTLASQAVPSLLDFAVKDCLQGTGLEGLGVPTDGASFAAAFPTSYRLIDGAYTDNTGAAMAVARMQRDCGFGAEGSGTLGSASPEGRPTARGTADSGGASPLDCTATPKLIIVDHDPASPDPQWSAQRLFAPPAGTATINEWSALMERMLAPLATIFDAPFPTRLAGYGSGSSWWNGTLTTVDNPWYGVKAGWRVRVALFFPTSDSPLTPALRIHGMMTRDDAAHYASLFTGTYAADAQAQATAIAPLLEEFLMRAGE